MSDIFTVDWIGNTAISGDIIKGLKRRENYFKDIKDQNNVFASGQINFALKNSTVSDSDSSKPTTRCIRACQYIRSLNISFSSEADLMTDTRSGDRNSEEKFSAKVS